MTASNRPHRVLMGIYVFGAAVALAAAWFPSFLCRAGSAVLVIGFAQMIWQRRVALVKGVDAQIRLSQSLLYHVPFLTGVNLLWMGLPFPVDPMAKAWSNCLFLPASVLLLAIVYLWNVRVLSHQRHEAQVEPITS